MRAILFAALVADVELISMATHGRGGILDRLLGSVTAAVLRAVEPGPVDPALAPVSEQALERVVAEARHLTEQHLQGAEAYLRATAEAKLPLRHARVVALAGASAKVLVDVARGEHADLVVLATHGRRGADWLLHGSVAHGVLRHSEAPVLILHGAEAPVA